MTTPPDSGFGDPTNQPAPSVARPLCRECYHSEAGCTCARFSPLYMANPEPDLVFLRRRRDEICQHIAELEKQEDFNARPAWLLSKEREEKIADALRDQFTEDQTPPVWLGVWLGVLIIVGAGVGIALAALVIKLLFK